MRLNIKPDFDLEKLKDLCCRVYEINYEDLFSTCRKRNLVDARRALYFILKDEYGFSELAIARMTGDSRDHSTIIHLNETTRNLLRFDYSFCTKYKVFYESFTLSQFVLPIPAKPTEVNTKNNNAYKYYTDQMLAKSRISLDTRIRYISDKYKLDVLSHLNKTGNISDCSVKFGISRGLIEAIVKDDSIGSLSNK